MAVGRTAFQTANDINSQVGGICLEMDNLVQRIGDVQAFMLATDLTAPPFNMSSGDSGVVKGAMTVLEAVHQQYLAQGNLTFVRQCIGIPN